jgi:hypothetical protein
MTRFLANDEKPDGWKLEDILSVLQDDIVRRCNKIIGDNRPEARKVMHNNFEILRMLGECIDRAHESTRVLNTLGPSEAATGGPPRIGKT